MKAFKIIISYILGIILFISLNLIGVLMIVKNTFNETVLNEVVSNIDIYDIVVGKLINLNDLDLNSESTVKNIVEHIGKDLDINPDTIDFIIENEKVKNVFGENIVNILLNNYNGTDKNVDYDKINSTIDEALTDYEQSSGINIDDKIKEKFNEKIKFYLERIENKIKNLDSSSISAFSLNQDLINKVIKALILLIIIELILIIVINRQKVFLINIGIPLLGVSTISICIGVVRMLVLNRFSKTDSLIWQTIYCIIKYSFNYLLEIGLGLFLISIILITIYHILKNKD